MYYLSIPIEKSMKKCEKYTVALLKLPYAFFTLSEFLATYIGLLLNTVENFA